MKIEVRNLGYKYPKTKNFLLKKINFSLYQGEILSILGPNGAGKTTLLSCLINFFNLTEGDIFLDEIPIPKISRKEIAKKMGYVPQFHDSIYAYSVLEFVTMGRTPYIDVLGSPSKKDKTKALEAINTMNINHLVHKNYTTLSGGEKQQVMLARTLAQDPAIIMLDEPTNHLDYGNQIRTLSMLKTLSSKGYTIIMTTHNPNHALMMGGKAAIVNFNQEFMFGSTKKILTKKTLKNIYRLNLEMLELQDKGRTICVPPDLNKSGKS
ncbi:MAG: ABC transporter ATP-binding protein [Desulfobacteraceae bacterium]|nr:ABC transporter ATP-binding protein [Desulfobacteraceae bacterium]